MKKEKFDKLYLENKTEIAAIKEKSSKMSIIRLILFFLIAIFAVLWAIKYHIIYVIAVIVFSIGFIAVAFVHAKISRQKNYLEMKNEVIEDYFCRFDNRWTNFSDGASEVNTSDLAFLSDLDIVGDASLFKYINVTRTRGGRAKLISRLSNPKFEEVEYLENQQALKDLSADLDFCLDLQTNLRIYAKKAKSKSLESIVSSVGSDFKINIALAIIGALSSIAFYTLLVLAIIGATSFLYFQLMLIFQIAIALVTVKLYAEPFSSITLIRNLAYTLPVYKTISEAKFTNKKLDNAKIAVNKAIKGIDYASKIEVLDSFRQNFVSFVLCNVLMPWNLMILFFYRHFILNYFKDVEESIDSFEEFEVLASLAVIPQVKENICLPTLTDDIKISFVDLAHPLLIEEKCVPNSFSDKASVNIITGSNMSGKTSFLRTIGINLCLMNACGYVNAKVFSSAYLKIFTSMRISDDISQGISSFYAEILRIKKAIDYQKTGLPMIAFIDEVFRGTNSNDRICGAISMIKNLCKDNVMLFITTHDFELCEITDEHVKNYHFTEHYEGEQILFDYLLKNGKCKTTNAQFLLKLAGIIN